MRAKSDEIYFKDWLLDIGNGNKQIVDDLQGIQVDNDITISSLQSIVNHIFSNDKLKPESLFEESRCILAPINESVFHLNEEVLKKIDQPSVYYYSADELISREDDNNQFHLTTEYLNRSTRRVLHLIIYTHTN